MSEPITYSAKDKGADAYRKGRELGLADGMQPRPLPAAYQWRKRLRRAWLNGYMDGRFEGRQGEFDLVHP